MHLDETSNSIPTTKPTPPRKAYQILHAVHPGHVYRSWLSSACDCAYLAGVSSHISSLGVCREFTSQHIRQPRRALMSLFYNGDAYHMDHPAVPCTGLWPLERLVAFRPPAHLPRLLPVNSVACLSFSPFWGSSWQLQRDGPRRALNWV